MSDSHLTEEEQARRYKLWHETWTTKEERNADSKGVIKFRGFPGKYKVTVNGKTTEMILK